jgi:hypothetical protein
MYQVRSIEERFFHFSYSNIMNIIYNLQTLIDVFVSFFLNRGKIIVPQIIIRYRNHSAAARHLPWEGSARRACPASAGARGVAFLALIPYIYTMNNLT